MQGKTDISALQMRLLAMMKKIHNILVENDIRYYMIGGTLLGAVRHKDFIPWDDDMDIGVPRKDYNRLMRLPKEVWDRHDLCIGCYTHNPDYKHKFVKIYDKNSTLVYGEGHEVSGIFVDIFPVDGIGETNKMQEEHLKEIAYFKKQLWYSYGYPHQDIIYEHRDLALEKGSLYWHEALNECLSKYDFDESSKAGILIGLYGTKEIMDREIFGVPELISFGDTKLYGMQDSNQYLTNLFGDYMKLPPKEDRVPKHILGQFEFCDLNLPYEEYLKKQGW